MINVPALIQLKAFARIDGLWLALLWTASFAAIMYLPQSMMGSVLMFATPMLMAWRLIKFRNYALDGVISFRRALAYGCYTILYASLLFAVVQALYFQFLDGGRFLQMMNDALQTVEPVYKQSGIDLTQPKAAIEQIGSMKPIELAFVFMMQNLTFGFFLSLIVAAIGMKRTGR